MPPTRRHVAPSGRENDAFARTYENLDKRGQAQVGRQLARSGNAVASATEMLWTLFKWLVILALIGGAYLGYKAWQKAETTGAKLMQLKDRNAKEFKKGTKDGEEIGMP